MPDRVTVIIPNWNGRHWLEDCLRGLNQQTYRQFDTTIVDNGSSDGSIEWIRNHAPHVALIANPENTGFAAAANAGIAASDAPLVALLNTDTIPSPQWLESLANVLQSSEGDRSPAWRRHLPIGDRGKQAGEAGKPPMASSCKPRPRERGREAAAHRHTPPCTGTHRRARPGRRHEIESQSKERELYMCIYVYTRE